MLSTTCRRRCKMSRSRYNSTKVQKNHRFYFYFKIEPSKYALKQSTLTYLGTYIIGRSSHKIKLLIHIILMILCLPKFFFQIISNNNITKQPVIICSQYQWRNVVGCTL